MGSRLAFRVVGDPKPQGSKKAFVVGGRAVLTEAAGKPLRDWRTTVTEAAWAAAKDDNLHRGSAVWPAADPVAVEIVFFMPRPQSAAKGWVYARRRPDVDKLLRSTLDACTGVLWADDSLVVAAAVTKELSVPPSPTGAWVEVRQLGDSEKAGMTYRAQIGRALDRKGVDL